MEQSSKSKIRFDRILEAATTVFSQKSYRDAAVDDIASESQTSKGGIYFYFPNKQAIFLALLDRMSNLLHNRITKAMESEPNVACKGDVALLTILRTFAAHKTLTRLFLVEALGAGREFQVRIGDNQAAFSKLIQNYLDEAVAIGLIEPLDSELASVAWFGAVNQVVTRWILTDQPLELEETYPALRALLRRSVGLA